MPIGNRLTNPGRPLTSEYFGGDSDTAREIPAEFRAACSLKIVEIPLPWDQPLIPLSDPVLASKAEQKATSERIRRTTYKQVGPITLHEVYTSKDKQLGARTRTMRFEGDTIASPGPARSVETKDLGNRHFIENVEDDGTLFSGATSTKEIADVLPEVFKANIPSYEYATTLTGLITVPQILGPSEFYRSETQTDVFNMRRTTKTRSTVGGLPITFQESKLTPEQQVETIYNTLDNGLQVLVPTATMIEGQVTNLGNGQSVMRVGIVPNVFAKKKYSVSMPNLIPAEFRATKPVHTEENIQAGDAGPVPLPLPGGFFAVTDEDVTDLTHKLTINYIDASFTTPVVLVDQELTQQFGGGLLFNIRTLDTSGSLTLDYGLNVVSSSVKRLGNGLDIKETRQLISGTWPILTTLTWDEEMQSFSREDRQVVAPSYTPTVGTYFVESRRDLDPWHAMLTRTTRTPVATGPGSAIVTYQYAPFRFPGRIFLAPGGGGYYERRASAQLCRHTVRTWWQVSATPPSVTVDEMIMDRIIISDLNNITTLAYSGDCLHDAITTFGVLTYAATTPSATDYNTTWIGNEKVISATVSPTSVPSLWKVQTKSVVMR
jgi:hypothetical protein